MLAHLSLLTGRCHCWSFRILIRRSKCFQDHCLAATHKAHHDLLLSPQTRLLPPLPVQQQRALTGDQGVDEARPPGLANFPFDPRQPTIWHVLLCMTIMPSHQCLPPPFDPVSTKYIPSRVAFYAGGNIPNSSMTRGRLLPRMQVPRVSGMHKATHAPKYLPFFWAWRISCPLRLVSQPSGYCAVRNTGMQNALFRTAPRSALCTGGRSTQTPHTGTVRVGRVPSESG